MGKALKKKGLCAQILLRLLGCNSLTLAPANGPKKPWYKSRHQKCILSKQYLDSLNIQYLKEVLQISQLNLMHINSCNLKSFRYPQTLNALLNNYYCSTQVVFGKLGLLKTKINPALTTIQGFLLHPHCFSIACILVPNSRETKSVE